MKFLIFALLLTFNGLGSASTPHPIGEYIYKTMHSEGPTDQAIAIINDYLDQVIANIRVVLNALGLHTIPLPALDNLAIGDTINMNLTNGFLAGLNTLHRTGDCVLAIETNGDIILTLDGGLNDMALGYGVALNLSGLMLPNLSLKGDLSTGDLRFTLRIAYDFSIQVETLELKTIGNLNLILGGLGDIVNVIIQFLSQIIASVIKDSVGNFLSTVLKDLINELLNSLIPTTTTTTTTETPRLQGQQPVLINALLGARNSQVASSISIGNANIKIKA